MGGFFLIKDTFPKCKSKSKKVFVFFLHIYEHKKSSSYFIIFGSSFSNREKNSHYQKNYFHITVSSSPSNPFSKQAKRPKE